MDHPDRQQSSPAENPYGRPESALQHTPVQTSRAARIAHRIIAILIATFCALQFVGIWALILRYVFDYGLGEMPLVAIAQKLAMPFTLALAGVFLAFGRKLSVLLFAAYLLQYAYIYGGSGRIDVISLTLILGFTAYAAWRWKQGALTGWPHAKAQAAAEGAGT